MESSSHEIVTREEARLRRVGIEWKHIHVVDGIPVIIVDTDTMESLITERESGQIFRGRFVCCSGKFWTGSYVDECDVHHFKEGMTEQIAYRFVLGYRIGRAPQTSRYAGYNPRYRVKKNRGFC